MSCAIAHEILPHVIGEIDHFTENVCGNLRKLLLKQIHLYVRLRIADFHDDEPIHKRDVLPHHTLIQSRFITRPVGVCRDDETEHGIRLDEFTTIFSDAER